MSCPNFGTSNANTLQVADMLPSKTIPEANRKRHARTLKAKAKKTGDPPKNKARGHSIETEETEDDDHPRNSTSASFNVSIESITEFQFSHPKKVCSLLCCAQFHFNQGCRRQKLRKGVRYISFM